MKIYGSRKREALLESNGFEFKGYEYKDGLETEVNKYKDQGYDVELLRETSDTQGLPMYSIWIRKPRMGVDPAIAKYLPKHQRFRLTSLSKERDLDGVSYWWTMDPNPDDEMQEKVSGHSYGIQDLKNDIDSYIYHNMRLGYDY